MTRSSPDAASPYAAPPPLPPAAVITGSAAQAGTAIAAFAAALRERGFRVGGLIQQTRRDDSGRKTAMLLHDLDNGRRFTFSQDLGAGSRACSVDETGMAEASASLRQAIAAKADLVVVNKFSHLEAEGRGFHAEILSALAERLPLLTAVHPDTVDAWQTFTGGRGLILPPSEEALWRWWGPERLVEDLIRAVPDDAGTARRVVYGLNWIMVEGPHGVGLAHTPPRDSGGCAAGPGPCEGRPLRELAALLRAADPLAAAVGLAAVNAHLNRADRDLPPGNGLDSFGDAPGRVVSVGAFPDLRARFPDLAIIEKTPGPDRHPPTAAPWLLPTADSVIITASTLVDRALPSLVRAAAGAQTLLLGPGTPLTPRLFTYGLTTLAGFLVTDPVGCARAIALGAGARTLKQFGRTATLTANGN